MRWHTEEELQRSIELECLPVGANDQHFRSLLWACGSACATLPYRCSVFQLQTSEGLRPRTEYMPGKSSGMTSGQLKLQTTNYTSRSKAPNHAGLQSHETNNVARAQK